MRNTKVQLMSSVAAVIRKYKKKYCTASQEKLIELLADHYGVTIHRRMLNYHLADLRKFGLIRTIRRTHRNKDGTLCLQTSATCLTPAGYWELWKLGCEWAKKMYNKLIARYCPTLKDNIEVTPEPQEGEILRRRVLAKEVMKSEAYRKAFGVDDTDKRRVPNF